MQYYGLMRAEHEKRERYKRIIKGLRPGKHRALYEKWLSMAYGFAGEIPGQKEALAHKERMVQMELDWKTAESERMQEFLETYLRQEKEADELEKLFKEPE